MKTKITKSHSVLQGTNLRILRVSDLSVDHIYNLYYWGLDEGGGYRRSMGSKYKLVKIEDTLVYLECDLVPNWTGNILRYGISWGLRYDPY